jgi:hypothetical protein
MEGIDAIARISQLLLSRRISANLVLGVLLAVGIGAAGFLLRPSIVVELLALGTTLAALIVVILLAFGYGLANLINGSVIGLGRTLNARYRTAQHRKRAIAEAEAKKEQQANTRRVLVDRLCTLIPHLTEGQQHLLKVLNDDSSDQEIAWNRAEFYREFSHLLTSGFLRVVERDLPGDKELYQLTPEGIEAIRAYRQAGSEGPSESDPSSPGIEA